MVEGALIELSIGIHGLCVQGYQYHNVLEGTLTKVRIYSNVIIKARKAYRYSSATAYPT
jgi:hypothetical protein